MGKSTIKSTEHDTYQGQDYGWFIFFSWLLQSVITVNIEESIYGTGSNNCICTPVYNWHSLFQTLKLGVVTVFKSYFVELDFP